MLKLLIKYFKLSKNYRLATKEYFKIAVEGFYKQCMEEKQEKKGGKKDV